MNRFCRKIKIIMMSIGVFLGLSACQMKDSYKEFNIVNVTECNMEEYVSSDNLKFARVNDITIVPEIKEIRHGEYIIYVSAYSKEKAEYVMLKKVTL